MNQIKIKLGLLFEQAILFGVLFIFAGLFGLTQTIFEIEVFVDIITIFFCLVGIIIGLIPISSKKTLLFSKEEDYLTIRSTILFFIKKDLNYKLSDYEIIFLGKSNRKYSAGGGFLPTARNFYSLKQIDVFIQSIDGKKKIQLKNVGKPDKAKEIFENLTLYTNLKPKVKSN
jgi:hypothetical protein